MKKIIISLLMVVATINAMAVTYNSLAQLTLKSSDNKSCTIGIGESADLNDGLNPGYYAEMNEEGKAVQFYVDFGGKKYQNFVSSPTTMTDLQLGVKTNASTSYTLTAANVTGSLRIKFNGVEYTIDANGTVFSDVTLPASSTLPAAGDEANYKVNPSAPLVKGICFNYEKLQLTKYDGAKVEVFADGAATAEVTATVAGDAQYEINLSALASGKYIVKIDLDGDNAADEEYVISVKPAITVVP